MVHWFESPEPGVVSNYKCTGCTKLSFLRCCENINHISQQYCAALQLGYSIDMQHTETLFRYASAYAWHGSVSQACIPFAHTGIWIPHYGERMRCFFRKYSRSLLELVSMVKATLGSSPTWAKCQLHRRNIKAMRTSQSHSNQDTHTASRAFWGVDRQK